MTIFFLFREEKQKGALLFASASLILLPVKYLGAYESFTAFLFNYGVLIALPPIRCYSGECGGSNTPIARFCARWGFYLYYPLHMAALVALLSGIITRSIGKAWNRNDNRQDKQLTRTELILN